MQRTWRQCWTAVPLLAVLVLVSISPAWFLLVAAQPGGNSNAASPFGEQAVALDGISFEDSVSNIAMLHGPVVLVIYDDADKESLTSVWQPLIRSLSEGLGRFSARVCHAKMASPVGVGLEMHYSIPLPAILLFDGGVRVATDGSNQVSLSPQAFSGEVDAIAITRWVVSNISPLFIYRIETAEDHANWFNRFPKQPWLPRVLYLTAGPNVGPVIKVVSQLYQSDAAFGAVVGALNTPERRAIAASYGIQDDSDLPALFFLQPKRQSRADEVVRLEGITKHSTVQNIAEKLVQVIPDTYIAAQIHHSQTGDDTALKRVRSRKASILNDLGQEMAELSGNSAAAAANQPPDVAIVATQAEWQRHCVDIRPTHICLAVVSSQHEMDSAKGVFEQAVHEIWRSVGEELKWRLHFIMLENERSAGIMEYFGVGRNGLPDAFLVTATSPRMFYRPAGSFSVDSLVRLFLTKTQVKQPIGGTRFIARMVPPLEDAPRQMGSNDSATATDGDEADL